MIKSRLCDLIGIKYPIIQAGMGPFSNNNLGVASANAGVLGLLSTSGVFDKETQPWIYKAFVSTAGADYDDDMPTVMEKVLKRTYNLVKDKGGVFGINVMVSAEVLKYSHVIIDTAIRVREENPDIKKHFKVIFTSAGDPLGWKDKIKGAGFTWMHVVPSVKAALRCKKAGVDVIVASGHEGGFHTSWEPVHSMILLPAVVETVSDKDTLVVGAGGFCRRQDPRSCTGPGRRRRADGHALPGHAGERLPPDLEGRSCGCWRQGNTRRAWLCRPCPLAEDAPQR